MFLHGTTDNAMCTHVVRVALRRDPRWCVRGRDGVFGRDGARPSRGGCVGRVALRRVRIGPALRFE